MDRFTIASEVTKLLPKMQVVIVTAYNLDNKTENPDVTAFAQVQLPKNPIKNLQNKKKIYIYIYPTVTMTHFYK